MAGFYEGYRYAGGEMRTRPLVAYGAMAIIATSLTLGSCGGEESGSALDEALGYLPADAAIAIAISTDLESEQHQNLDDALQRFGIPGGIEAALLGDDFGPEGISFASDLEPLLGEDIVIGLSDFPSEIIFPDDESSDLALTAAIRTSDGAAVEELLSGPGELKVIDEVAGGSIYGRDQGDTGPLVAVEGDVVIAAETPGTIQAALERADTGEGLDEETFAERLGDLPEDALVRASADAQTLLDSAGAGVAASVPWVGALESFGLTASVGEEAVGLEFLAASTEVSEEELPIAAGTRGPALLADGISVANLDQGQTVRFLLDAIEASVPSAAFEEVAGEIADQAGAELPRLADAFGEGVRGERASGDTFSRSEVSDRDAVADALSALKDEVPRLQEISSGGGAPEVALDFASTLLPALPVGEPASFEPGTKVERVPGELHLYRLREAPQPLPPGLRQPGVPPEALEGLEPQELVFGLIGDVWVTAPNLRIAREVAAATPDEEGALPGAIAGRAPLDAEDLAFEGSEGGGVTVTVLELGIEAATDGLRLRLEAGL